MRRASPTKLDYRHAGTDFRADDPWRLRVLISCLPGVLFWLLLTSRCLTRDVIDQWPWRPWLLSMGVLALLAGASFVYVCWNSLLEGRHRALALVSVGLSVLTVMAALGYLWCFFVFMFAPLRD